MMIVRPVTPADLDPLVALANRAEFGLTSLPPDRELLRKRIRRSEHSFRCVVEEPGGEVYTFVMEDLTVQEVIGTSSILSKVGGFEPFYAFKIEVSLHESGDLNIRKSIPMLRLVTEHSGPTEIGGLFMTPDRRAKGYGRLMSLCRFLFMADHPELFEPVIVAEMRGVVDDFGRSPFWEAVGKRFFGLEYPKADYLSMKDKRFIADLIPRNPIYVPLLPDEAQAVIGRVHRKTEPAMRLLLEEGFSRTDMVDIFDAGPLITCDREAIRTVRESRLGVVVGLAAGQIQSEPFLIGNNLLDFRAGIGAIEVLGGENVRITESAASALALKTGDRLRYSPLRPAAQPQGEK